MVRRRIALLAVPAVLALTWCVCTVVAPAVAMAQSKVQKPEASANKPRVGDVAPEIKGVSVNGKAMKLSDYRGKVVVLDFFGDW